MFFKGKTNVFMISNVLSGPYFNLTSVCVGCRVISFGILSFSLQIFTMIGLILVSFSNDLFTILVYSYICYMSKRPFFKITGKDKNYHCREFRNFVINKYILKIQKKMVNGC